MHRDDEKNTEHMDRRKKTPLDWVSTGGSVGGAGVGLLIFQLVMGQGNTLDRHGDMIQANTQGTKAVLEELEEIKGEFTLDIQEFKLKHMSLKQQLDACERQQMSMMDKLEDIEDIETALNQWRDLEQRLKDWASRTFQSKK